MRADQPPGEARRHGAVHEAVHDRAVLGAPEGGEHRLLDGRYLAQRSNRLMPCPLPRDPLQPVLPAKLFQESHQALLAIESRLDAWGEERGRDGQRSDPPAIGGRHPSAVGHPHEPRAQGPCVDDDRGRENQAVRQLRRRVLCRFEPADPPAKARLALELDPECGLLSACRDNRELLDACTLGGQERAGEQGYAADPHPQEPGLRQFGSRTDDDSRLNGAGRWRDPHTSSVATFETRSAGVISA